MSTNITRLLTRIANEVAQQIEDGYAVPEANLAALFDSVSEKRSFLDSKKELAEKIRQIILHWDVRCLGSLRNKFRPMFPPKLRSGDLYVEYDKNDDWVVSAALAIKENNNEK